MYVLACTPSIRFKASKRLIAALIASALVHAWFADTLNGGRMMPRGVAPAPSSLSVVLEPTPRRDVAIPVAEMPVQAMTSREVVVAPVPVAQSPRRKQETVVEHARASSAASAGTSDPTYYAARALDVYPALATPLPVGPSRGARTSTDGQVELLVSIDETGAVKEVTVVDARPAGHFEDEARQFFLAARFAPAERNGRRVKSRVLIHVSFGLTR